MTVARNGRKLKMPNCSVFSCKKRSETSSLQKDNVTFHLFPKDAMIRDLWIRACANHFSWTPKRTNTICSEHFEASCFIIQANNKRKLKQHAAPTLKLLKESIKIEQLDSQTIGMQEDTKSSQIQESNTIKDQPCTSQSGIIICKSPKLTHNLQLQDTPRKKKLEQLLEMKNKQIKRLQSQKRYLKMKVVGLQKLLNKLSKRRSLINKEDRLVLDKIGVDW